MLSIHSVLPGAAKTWQPFPNDPSSTPGTACKGLDFWRIGPALRKRSGAVFYKGIQMYARSCNNKVSADALAAVCKARARNFMAARMREAFAGYLA